MNTHQGHVVETTPRLGELAEVFPCRQDRIQTSLSKGVLVSGGGGWGARRAALVVAQESNVPVDLRLEDGTVHTGATVLSYGKRTYSGDVVVRAIDYDRIVEISLDATARVGLWATDATTT